jgi:predicted dehydrogenase
MSKVLAGIIGLGVGEAHISGYQSHPKCEVVKVCDFDSSVYVTKKDSIGNIPFVTDYKEIIQDNTIDVVSIASYDNFHFEQIMAAIEQYKHVFVEKPLCVYRREADIIFNALEKKPYLKLSSNLILRKSERFIDLKKRIENHELGQLFHVNAAYNYGRIHKIIDGWRGDIPFYSVTYGGGVHLIDLLLWLFEEKISEVFSFGNNICTKESKFKYSDLVTSVLRFDSGATGQLSSNYGCVSPHFHQLDVYGKNATFVNQIDEAKIYSVRDSNEFVNLSTKYPGVHKGDLLTNFIDSIIGNITPTIGKKEVFNVMSVCFAIEDSITSKKVEKVDYYY